MNHEAVLSQMRDTVQRADHCLRNATNIKSRAEAAGLKAQAQTLLRATELAADEAEQSVWAGSFPRTDLENPFQK